VGACRAPWIERHHTPKPAPALDQHTLCQTISGEIGGTPDLTAVFVVVTGIVGAILGKVLLNWFPIHSALARSALLGVGARGAGTVKAHEIGRPEGSVAGLVIVLVGLFNVLLAPLVAACFRIS
jgi:putative effector of murein hydrolase